MFVIYSKIEQKEAQKNYTALKKWFDEHPDRNDCVCDMGTIKRGSIKEDVLKRCKDDVVLKDKPARKKKVQHAKVQARKKDRGRHKRGAM